LGIKNDRELPCRQIDQGLSTSPYSNAI